MCADRSAKNVDACFDRFIDFEWTDGLPIVTRSA